MASKHSDGLKTSEHAVRTVLPCGQSMESAVPNLSQLNSVLEKMLEKLETFVDEKSLKRSDARRKILETIIYEVRHFRVPDFLERLGKRHPEVGKATFYRNLPVFVDSGVLLEGPTDSVA